MLALFGMRNWHWGTKDYERKNHNRQRGDSQKPTPKKYLDIYKLKRCKLKGF